MSTSEKVVEVEFLDMVHNDGHKESIGSPSDQNDDTWFNLSGVKQIIKEYILNEPDVARVSNESETFVLIEEKTDDQTQSEQPIVEEEIVTTKVSSEESSFHWPGETDDNVNENNQDIDEEKEERKRSTRTISLTSPEEMESDKENDPTQTPTRGGSKRLDLGRYQPINAENKTKRSVATKRLDTSRFSKFQEDSPDSSSNVKVTRNFTVSSTPRKLNIEKPTPMTTTNSDHCIVCKKTVYPMEKITADDVVYHKTCFRCRECNRQLSLGNFAQSKQFLYCKPHFKQLFQLKGNYDDAFDGTSRAMRATGLPDTENGIDQVDEQEVRQEDAAQFEGTKSLKDQFEKGAVSNVTVKKSFDARTNESRDSNTPEERMVSENEPVLRADVVRASDVIDDRMAISGMKSLRDQFERGESNVSTSAKSVDFQEEIRAAKESEVEASYGQVAESTPVRNEDVVRSDVRGEEVKTSSGGIRSLKDRFEKGKVSNIDVTPVKPVIDIHPLEDYDSGNFDKGVSESTPVVRDDVVRSSEKVEDSFISTGGARSLKARFEKGNVSNIEEKSKEKIEITPGKLEDYDEGNDGADGGVSESTPIQRDDVVKEGKSDEDPGIKTGAARSLKNLFEKGEVHNIEEKPRPVLERSPKSLDQLEPSSDGVVESTPEVRTDIVRETSTRDEPMNIQSGGSRSLMDRWEKGEVETAPAKPKEVVDIRAEFEGQGQVAESKPEVREDLVRESTEVPEEVSPGAGSLRAQWEAGEVVGAEVRTQKEELSPKRLSAYYDGEPEETGEIESEQLVEVATEEMVKEKMEELEETTRNDDFVEEQDALPAQDELEVFNEHQDVDLQEEQDVDLQEEQVVNGHVEENGFEGEFTSEPAEDTLISFEAAPGQDIASWEIKAARSGALQSQDGGDDIMNETANEDTAIDGNDSGLLIDIGDGDVNVTVGDDEMSHD